MTRPLALLALVVALVLTAAVASAADQHVAPQPRVARDAPIVRPDLTRGARGPQVCDAMWLLRGNNTFEIRTYKRTPDGGPNGCLFGPRAAAATRAMKYRLGYPISGVNERFGRNLRALLLGQVKLPPLYAKRRANRHPRLELEASYPLRNRAAFCGAPGYGTHSPTERGYLWQDDNAIDLCAAEGTPILAVRAGTICNKIAGRPGTGRFSGVRFYLCDSRGVRWFYQHTKGVAAGVRLGLRVTAGQTIAYVGVAGVAHLHLACEPSPCRTYTGFQQTLGAELR